MYVLQKVITDAKMPTKETSNRAHKASGKFHTVVPIATAAILWTAMDVAMDT